MVEPRFEEDYDGRAIEAARRAMVDIMQVLGSFKDSLVLVGGWVPDLLIENAEEEHIGSIDIDFALNIEALAKGQYAALLELLVGSGRYKPGTKQFQMITEVSLNDGLPSITVEIDFMGPAEWKTEKNHPKLFEGFRLLKAEGCSLAFYAPEGREIEGQMISGAVNKVPIRIASIPDFLVMKCLALKNRDKPKDAYDICYCLDFYQAGRKALANEWLQRTDGQKYVQEAVEILKDKFGSVSSFGPQQVVAFHNSLSTEEREIQARRAFELVQDFIKEVEQFTW